jgi:Transcriptional regulators
MEGQIRKLKATSLKAACVDELERLIISGALPIGSSIPPERELASRLGASRPVVHEAMVELAAKGFVRVEPRKGAFVNDFYRSGTLAIIESIVEGEGGDLSPEALADILAFRMLIEVEASRLAARGRGNGYLDALRELIMREELVAAVGVAKASVEEISELDFEFHLLVAQASGSLVYPLLVNSFRPLYLRLGERFYERIARRRSGGRTEVLAFHRRVVGALAAGDERKAAWAMREMLAHGEATLGVKRDGAKRG